MERRSSTSPVRFPGLLTPVALIVAAQITVATEQPSSTRSSGKIPAAQAAAIEQRLIEAARREPPTTEAQHALAAFYIQQGKLDQAIPHLQRAQTIEPGHYASGYDLAVALLQTDKPDAARRQVEQLLKVRQTGELLNLLGDIEERAGNLTLAAESYQRAVQSEPTEEHLFDWGNNLIQLRAFEPASEVFTAAIARHPKSARLRVGLGITRYSLGQYEDAVKSFCEASDLAPSDPRPYQFLGEMYGVAPDPHGEVAKRLARFVKTHPRNALAHLYYALSLSKGQGGPLTAADAERIEGLLRRAVTLDPKLVKGFVELGNLLSDQKRYSEAIPLLRRAIELQPDLAQAHYRLAQAYQRTGQQDLAAKEFEIFKRLTKGQSSSR